jgi:putative polysaccharide polymerase protein
MWLHYFIFIYIVLTFIISKVINKKFSDKIFLFLNFLLLFILAAFRDVSVGNDTQEYYRVFKTISLTNSINGIFITSRFEIGYLLLNYLITRFTNNFNVLLFITSFIYLYSVFKFIDKYSKSKFVAIMLFFTFSMYYSIFNIQRQCIAIAIFLYAIRFLEKKQYIRYVLLILFATMFHYIAILLIFLCFIPKIDLYNKKIAYKYIILACFAACLIAYCITRFGIYIPYFGHYLTNSKYSEGGIRLASIALAGIRLGIIILLIIINGFKEHKSQNNLDYIFNYIAFLDCTISLAAIKFNLYDRVEDYLCIVFLVMISNSINSLDIKTNKYIINSILILITMFYLTISLMIRSNWYGIFPYVFIGGK